MEFMKNPYESYGKAQKKKIKYLEDDHREGDFDHVQPRKSHKFSIKNHRVTSNHMIIQESTTKKKQNREKDDLKNKVNKILDKRASNPLIINQLRRVSAL